MDFDNNNLFTCDADQFIVQTLKCFKHLRECNKNLEFHVFGSQPFNYILNGNFLKDSDIDILCNQEFYDEFCDLVNENKGGTDVKIDLKGGNSLDGSPSLLKYNLIDKLSKVMITIDGKVFKFDFVITSWHNIDEVISKYSQNLVSNKCLVYDYKFDNEEIKFNPLFSANMIKSLYRPDFCNGTMRTLLYYTNMYSKLFNENGLNIDYNLVKRKDVKYMIDLDSYKDNNEVFSKLLDTVFQKRTSWITFESDIYLRFLVFNELFTFPLTEDMMYYLENLNLLNKIKGEYDIYKRWLFLLKRTLSGEVLLKFLEKNGLSEKELMKSEDVLFLKGKMKLLVLDLGKNYMEIRDECSCYICMEEFNMSSPIHFCENGHFTHLSCAMKQKRIFINKALRDINFDEEFEEDTNNCCGMCREQQVDIDTLPVVDHSAIIDLYKYKDERMKDLDLYEYSDYLLNKNSSINICECNLTETSSDYILRKVEYLKKIK